MPGKYIKKQMDVFNLISFDDESEMKVHFQLLQFDCHYVENNIYKCLMFLVS